MKQTELDIFRSEPLTKMHRKAEEQKNALRNGNLHCEIKQSMHNKLSL